jgi:hypothetical protein
VASRAPRLSIKNRGTERIFFTNVLEILLQVEVEILLQVEVRQKVMERVF